MTGEAIVSSRARELDLGGDSDLRPDYPTQQWPDGAKPLTQTGAGQTGSGLGPSGLDEEIGRDLEVPIQYCRDALDYQTSSYNLSAPAIESVSGKSFDAYMRENLLRPAEGHGDGMS